MSDTPTKNAIGDPVPVIAASPRHLSARLGASVLTAIGAIAQALPSIAPQLTAAGVPTKWVSLLLPCGLVWLAVQRSLDAQNVQPVNMSVTATTEVPKA